MTQLHEKQTQSTWMVIVCSKQLWSPLTLKVTMKLVVCHEWKVQSATKDCTALCLWCSICIRHPFDRKPKKRHIITRIIWSTFWLILWCVRNIFIDLVQTNMSIVYNIMIRVFMWDQYYLYGLFYIYSI